jgi:hypothetical protein
MKRNLSWKTFLPCVAALLMPGISSAIIPSAQAQNVTSNLCSKETVIGTYSIELKGVVYQNSIALPYSSLGTYVANGQGNVQGTQTVKIGNQAPFQQTVIGTYHINSDCTGYATSNIGTFNLVNTEKGEVIYNIITVPDTNITGVSRRIFKP